MLTRGTSTRNLEVATTVPGGDPAINRASDLTRWQVSLLMACVAIVGGGVVGMAVAIKPKYGVVIVIAIAAGLVIIRKLEVGALALVSLVPMLSGLRRGWPVPGFRLTEVLTAGIAATVFLLVPSAHAVAWSRVEWLMLLFCSGGVVLGLMDARELAHHTSFQEYGTLIGPFQFFLLFRTIRIVLHSRTWRVRAMRTLLISSVPISLIALLQQANVPKVRSFLLSMTGSDVLAGNGSGYQVFARATGPFPHWTPLAGYITVLLVVGLGLILERDWRPLPARWLYSVVLLDTVALAFTAELSAIIGLVIALFLLGRSFRQLRRVMRAAAVALLGLAVVAGPYVASRVHNEYVKAAGTNRSSLVPQTVEFRLNIWEHQYFPAIGQRPITGYGIVNPSMVSWPATESQYVTVLERGGVVLFVLYIGLMVGLATSGLAVARSTDDPTCRVAGYSVAVLVLILIPMNSVFPYLEDSGLPQAFWTVVGIMLAGTRGPLPSIGFLEAVKRRLHHRVLGFALPVPDGRPADVLPDGDDRLHQPGNPLRFDL